MKIISFTALTAALCCMNAIVGYSSTDANQWAPSDSSAGLDHSETVITNMAVECESLNVAFLSTDNLFAIGKGGTLTCHGSMVFGYDLTKTYNLDATNVFAISDGGRLVYDNAETVNTSAGFLFGSTEVPKRRSLVSISGAETVADFRYSGKTFFNGNTSVTISDGATVYMGRHSGLGNLTNRTSVSAEKAYETLMTISGDDTSIYLSNLSGTARFQVGAGSGKYATNHVVMNGGSIAPLVPDGTYATQLAIASQLDEQKKISHGVFEMHGGSIDLWATGHNDATVNGKISIGPGNGSFLMSAGYLNCGDLQVGQNQPANYSEGQIDHTQRLHMTGGIINCRRLYLGSSNKLEAFKYQQAHVDLDGGVLQLNEMMFPSSAVAGGWAHGYFTADGGTLRAMYKDKDILHSFDSAKLGSKGLTVDNNGFSIKLTQGFTNKEGESGCLVFTGSGTNTYAPSTACSVSLTAVKRGILKFSKNTELSTKLVITAGASLSLEGNAGKLTLNSLYVPQGTILLDLGDTIHVNSSDIEFNNLSVRFSTTLDAASTFEIFAFDGDVTGNATIRDALRFIKIENTVTDHHATFSLVYDESNDKTKIVVSFRQNISALTDETAWCGPAWNADGWPNGVPGAMKVAAFSGSDAPSEVSVAPGAEVGAMSFSSNADYIFTGARLEFSAPLGGAWLSMLYGSATFNIPISLYHLLPISLASGTALAFNAPIIGGGIAKTGNGALTLAADNRMYHELSVGGGLNTIATAKAASNSAGLLTLTDGTLVFTNSLDDSEMAVETAVVLNSATSETNAVIIKTDSDIYLKNLTVANGALIKRGAGQLKIEASSTENTKLQSGYGPLLKSNNYRVESTTLVDFAADGTAPAPEMAQYAGFNIAEGEMIIKGTPGVTKTVNLKTGCCIGMNIAGDQSVFRQPALTIDGASVDATGNGHTTVGVKKCGGDGCAVYAPALRILNGGRYDAGNIRIGYNVNNSGAYPVFAITNATATAQNAFRFGVYGGTSDRGSVVRAKDATLAITTTGDGHHGFCVSGTVDADFDNCVVGGSKQISKLKTDENSAGVVRFRNGSVFAAFPYVDQAKANYDFTLAFDDSEWDWGGENKELTSPVGVGDGFYKKKRHIKMEGVGVILKPKAQCTFATMLPFIGTGGCVVAGEGTIKFIADTLKFTGLLDIRSGAVDLSESSAIAELAVRGPGKLEGGNIAKLTIRADTTGTRSPVLSGVSAERAIVDFGADSTSPVKGENILVAVYRQENPPEIGRWKVIGTGLKFAHAHLSVKDGEVRATVTESLSIIVR